jgi:hypothetical protein
MVWIFYGETRPYQGEFIRCQNDHIDYTCSHIEVAMLGGMG